MKLPLLSKDELLASDLVRASFDIRSATFTPERVSTLVFWLVTEFLYGRCAWLASAAAHEAGIDRYVAFLRRDGRLAHAVLACGPQRLPSLSGDCVDVMGRRTLASVRASVEREVGPVTVAVADPVSEEHFEGDEHLYRELALELPWFRDAMGHEARAMDGERLEELSVRLGHRPGPPPRP